ncbi:MAG TPA: histidine phosphatase family protein [Candidatus Udaeobacter sp.]|nr:histidine phosphatase family protein [Candidatus Udaeobacter sp.]
MRRFLFVRHAAHDLMERGVIAGRQSGVHLNACGREQAQQLVERLSLLPIEAIYCSPLERACETAMPLANTLRLPLQIADEFNEIDFGAWTGCTFAELKDVPEWQQWNSFRSTAVIPGGESMLAVQARALKKMSELAKHHAFVAVFSHGDVIRALLAHFLGIHLDLFQRIEIDSASASLIELGDSSVRVRLVNANAASSELLPCLRQL